MIKSKRLLFVAILLLLISLVLNFPFPHNDPYGETLAAAAVLNIPIRSAEGLQYVGIFSLLLLITSIFFFTRSVNNYHGRVVLLAIFIVMLAPSILISAYQKTFASGIYAISYESDWSNCNFHMINKSTLLGECELPFENYSDKDVHFTIEFYESFPDDMRMVSLLNKDDPYEVRLQGKERKVIKIESKIDVSTMETHIVNGSASHVNIILKAGRKVRKL